MYRLLSERNTPRWIIFGIDVTTCVLSLALAYLLRFNFSIPDYEFPQARLAFITIISARIGSFLVIRTYQGIIRYTGSRDAYRIFFTTLSGSAAVAIGNLSYYQITSTYLAPFSIL
ncbi:MAG: hypothetical protein ACKO1U_06850, partial [Bacteroidota bacterium]